MHTGEVSGAILVGELLRRELFGISRVRGALAVTNVSNDKKWVDEFVRELTFAQRLYKHCL